MADFDLSDADVGRVIDALENNGLFDEETKQDMLWRGAYIMYDLARAGLKDSGHMATGDTFKNIYFKKKMSVGKDGVPYIWVTIKGKDAHGQRYAVKGFVLNYGRSAWSGHGQVQPSYFWTLARLAAEPKILELWRKIAEIKLKEKGLI